MFRSSRCRVAATVALSLCMSCAHAGESENRKAGDAFRFLNPAVALAATLYQQDYEGTRQFGWSAGSTVVLTELLKRAFNRTSLGERPDGSMDAFPSGHVSIACQSATFVHERYSLAYALPLYATAAFTAYSRVDADRHRWRDVIAGCALGSALSTVFTTPYTSGVSVAPLAADGRVAGIMLSAEF